MSERICATVLSEPNWRAVLRRGNGHDAVPVSKWGWTPTSSRPIPLSLGGKRLDTEPGYMGLAEPQERLIDAVERLTRGTT